MSRANGYDEQIGAAMRAAYESGESQAEVSERFGKSLSTTRVWLRRAGTVIRSAEERHAGRVAGGGAVSERVGKSGTVPVLHGNTQRQYMTTCPRCRFGIYTGDATKRGPGHLGPVHAGC